MKEIERWRRGKIKEGRRKLAEDPGRRSDLKIRRATTRALSEEGMGSYARGNGEQGSLLRLFFLPSLARALLNFPQPCQVSPGTSH